MSLFDSPLITPTPQAWVTAALSDFPAFMQDHAACERKAAALAMSFVTKYPDRTALIDPMVSLAREELEHFAQVYRQMRRRGIPLAESDERDGYVNKMIPKLRHGREERFLDRLVLSGFIEARVNERFHMLAPALGDPELAQFYKALAEREAGHYKIFIQIAGIYFPEDAVKEAKERIARLESEAMLATPLTPRVH